MGEKKRVKREIRKYFDLDKSITHQNLHNADKEVLRS